MKRKIKYPEGGKVISSGTALPNSINQTQGNLGTVLQDPYAFSKAMGVTTLTPEQWKKLDAGQQQAIWRQGFDVAGFTQTGENSFNANGQTNNFAMGGPTGDEKPKPNYNFSEAIPRYKLDKTDSMYYEAGFNNMIKLDPAIVNQYGKMQKYGIPVNDSYPMNKTILNSYEDALNQMPLGKKLGVKAGAKAKAFAMGGNPQFDAVTGALSPLIGLIPGGQFINAGLDLVGNFLPAKKEEKVPSSGVYALGGRAKYFNNKKPVYEVEGDEVVLGGDVSLEGSSDSSKYGKIAKGPTHDKGGVDATGGKYVLSNRIGIDGSIKKENENSIASHAIPIMKALASIAKRPSSRVDREGENILTNKLNTLKDFNEKMLSLQDNNKKKFYYGGDTPDWELPDNYGQGSALNLQTGTPGITERIPETTMGINTNYNTPYPNISQSSLKTKDGGAARIAKPSVGVNLVPESYFANAPKEMAGETTQSKIGGVNALTGVGMGLSALGSLGQLGITMAEHRRNERENPEQNFFSEISQRAESTYNDSLEGLNAQKIKTKRDINDAYGSIFSNSQANSVNVDRAMKNMAQVQKVKGIADSNLNYDSAIADRKVGLAGLQMQGDTLQAQGAERNLINRQQNLANYFTNLGSNVSDATGQALNAIKIAQNARTQTQALSMLSQAYPNFTLEQLNGMLQIVFKQ